MAKKAKTNNKVEKKRFELNQNVVYALGGSLIACGLFLVVALLSYFFTWKVDHSEIDLGFWAMMKDPDVSIKNLGGKLGASLAHNLVYLGYGLAAFLYPYYFLQWGLRLLFDAPKKPMWRITGRTLFLLIWIPTTLAFLLPDSFGLLFGVRGLFLDNLLQQIVGPFGTGILILVSFGIFSVVVWKLSPIKIKQWFSERKKRNSETSIAEDKPQATVSKGVNKEIIAPTTSKAEESQAGNIEQDHASVLEVELAKEDIESENTDDSSDWETITPEKSKTEDSDDGILEVEQVKEEEALDDKEIKRKLKEFGAYDPTLDLSRFQLPPLDLLKQYTQGDITIDNEELEKNKVKIVNTLADYKIEIAKIKATIGPTVTLYEIVPAAGVRISKIKNLEDDIALSLAALGIRIIAPIPGKGTIGIEVPNQNPQMVAMRNLLASEKYQNTKFELPIALGKTISNETFIADLATMPHLLMAGATGQGKSVGLNVILTSILYKKHPSQVKFVLVDPKKVELTLFNKIERHYLAKLPNNEEAIITDTKKVIYTLNSLCIEMDERYDLLKNALVRNIKEYNTKFIERRLNPEEGHRYLPYIVLVIDEFADLIMTAGKEVETPIARLAQLARAIGIHLIVATQRPSVNVITGMIKANFPARIAFRVTAKVDSRTILDAGGAEQLIGKGDMLLFKGSDLIRIQCAFVDTPEIEAITDFIGSQQAYPEAYLLPEYEGEESEGSEVDLSDRDAMFEEAARVIVLAQQGSASLLQRKLRLGYNRAGRLIDQLEAAGIIGPFEGSKARQVNIKDEASLEQLLKNLNL
ncbi:MAG: DNA translocase FtsK [Cryomorphaceae bacterium]|nr:DNA translocase FtsK [Cryomorphaceae bacterium]